MIAFVWKESGGVDVAPPDRTGFGTAVLQQTLAYEFGAVTAMAYEPNGLRCTIRFPLAPRVGVLGVTEAE